MRKVVATLAGIVAMSTFVGAQGADAKKIEAGQAVYVTQKCATCHALKGAGGKMAGTLDGVGTKLKEAEIKKWLTAPADMEKDLKTKPKMLMSTFMKTHKLTDADLDALVAYLRTLK